MPWKKKQEPREVQLRCLCCNNQYTGQYHHAGLIKSYLNRHIFSNPLCQQYYTTNDLFFLGSPDLSSSIVDDNDKPSSAKKQRIVVTTHQFSPTDFGLTGTANGPCKPMHVGIQSSTSNKINHNCMNAQTLYVGHQPSILQENIEAALQNMQKNPHAHADTSSLDLIDLTGNSSSTPRSDEVSVHSSTGEAAFFDTDLGPVDNKDGDSMYALSSQQPLHSHEDNDCDIIEDPSPAQVPPTLHVGYNQEEDEVRKGVVMDNHLTAAVELMHILIKNGCHLNMFPLIMKWTSVVASRPSNECLFQTMGPITYNTLLQHVR